MTGLCKDCNWWDAVPRRTEGLCMLAASSGGTPKRLTLAYAFDNETYEADLITDSNFGCVQFKKREEVPM